MASSATGLGHTPWDNIKRNVRSVLVGNKDGQLMDVSHQHRVLSSGGDKYPTLFSFQAFERDYRHLLGESVPYRKYGYARLIDLLEALPDCVKIFR